jgi:hypothetical protein
MGLIRDQSRCTVRAAALRRSPHPDTPNLRSSAETWTDTVFGLINSASAISRLDTPLADPAEDLSLPRSQPVLGHGRQRVEAAAKADAGHRRRTTQRRLSFSPRTGRELRLRPPDLCVCLVIPVAERAPTLADRRPSLELRYICVSARHASELRGGLIEPRTRSAFLPERRRLRPLPRVCERVLGLRSPRCGLVADALRNNGPPQAACRRDTAGPSARYPFQPRARVRRRLRLGPRRRAQTMSTARPPSAMPGPLPAVHRSRDHGAEPPTAADVPAPCRLCTRLSAPGSAWRPEPPRRPR